MTRVSTPVAMVLIVMTLLGWSSVPLFLKHFSASIDPWTSNGWRYGFSAMLWAPVLIIAAARRTTPRGLWKAAIVPSVFNAAGQILFTWSHYKIEPGLLTFGLRIQIVCVAIGAYALFPVERRVIRHPVFLCGAAVVLAGTLGTVLFGDPVVRATVLALLRGDIAGDPARAVGVAMAIGSGALFAGYALSVRHWMRDIGSVTAFAAISQITALTMVTLMLFLGERAGATALALSAGQFTLLLASAVIGIALGHVFYYASIARLGVAVSSGVVQLQPIIVTAASAALFHERLTLQQILLGIAAILGAGVMLAVQYRLSKKDRAAAELEEAVAEQA